MQITTTLPGNLRLTIETTDIGTAERVFADMTALPAPADVAELQDYVDRLGVKRAPQASVA